MNQCGDERSLASLIERSAEPKRALVDLALGRRMKRHLEWFMRDDAGPHDVLIEDEAIGAIALRHRVGMSDAWLAVTLAWNCAAAAGE